MTGAVKTNKQIKRALILRQAGFSVAAIAIKTNISTATLTRHFKIHGLKRGTLSLEAVDAARHELLNDAGFISDMKTQIAASIVDDLAQVAALREAISLTLEQTMDDSSLPAHYKARSLAALATSIGLTQKTARLALNADNQPIEQDDLPSLYIEELSQEEIQEMREAQLQLDRETGVVPDDDEIIDTT